MRTYLCRRYFIVETSLSIMNLRQITVAHRAPTNASFCLIYGQLTRRAMYAEINKHAAPTRKAYRMYETDII